MPRRPSSPLLLASPSTTVATPAPVLPAAPRHGAGPLGPVGADRDPGLTEPRPSTWGRTPVRFYAALAVLVVALGALSLLAPSTPSYDPWSWAVWAREIVHGHLTITDTGTSWKPLPMILTIPFALFGSAAPDLWLVVARAGAIAAVLLAGRLAWRLTRELALARCGGGDPRALAVRGPAVLAGLLAVTMLGFAAKGGYITANGLGYSEGLAAALLLVAIECHLDGRRRAAFAVGFLVALDRPEIWLFWVPYGLWLAWRDRSMRAIVAAAILVQPVAWFLPVYLGSGHLGSSVARAQDPRANSLAYAGNPFWAELSRAAWPTMMLRAKGMALLVVLAAAVVGARLRPRRGDVAARVAGRPAVRALLVAAALAVGGLAWFVVIAVMTQLHFSGNDRYLVLGAALVDVAAGVGFGTVAVELARAIRHAGSTAGRTTEPTGGRATGPTGERATGRIGERAPTARGGGWTAGRSACAGMAVVAALFAFVPAWIAHDDFVALPRVHGALLYQARLRSDLTRAIARVGGPRRALACGRVMTEGFQVPMVAYALDVATPRVLAPPTAGGPSGPPPNLILQTQATRSSTLLPIVRTWPAHFAYRGSTGPWNVFTRCTPTA